jgi:hypothetical protein
MKSSNKSLSVDPWHTRLSMMPSCAYAGRMCHLFPRPNFVTWTWRTPSETTPNAVVQPYHRSQTHQQRQVGRTRTAISYVDSDLEGRHPVVVRYDGSLFSSSPFIAESDRSICPISVCETYDKGNLPSRIDTGMAV